MLAYAHIFRIVATEWKGLTNGAGGIGNIPRFPVVFGYDFSSKTGAYWIVLSLVLAFALVYGWIRRQSTWGSRCARCTTARMRRARSASTARWLKALMLLLSAFMTGMMGAFNAHYINFLEPDYAFSGLWTMLPIVAAIFGGYRTITGPLVGAVVVYLARPDSCSRTMMPVGHQIVLGALLLGAMILFAPQGLLPVFARRVQRGLRMAGASGDA